MSFDARGCHTLYQWAGRKLRRKRDLAKAQNLGVAAEAVAQRKAHAACMQRAFGERVRRFERDHRFLLPSGIGCDLEGAQPRQRDTGCAMAPDVASGRRVATGPPAWN